MGEEAITHLKILIVDDEESIRRLLSQFLIEMGNECDTAINGQMGFIKVVESHYDFILMDIRMPNMNGIECIKAIRQVDPDIPILIITAFSSEEEVKTGLENGANGIIRKPFDFKELIRLMTEILKDCRLRE
ncbi:MAG: response regulator [Candidatus Aureabacteria bacterium]|nr:response regulator [Candidatus Auribacterota bacterium]